MSSSSPISTGRPARAHAVPELLYHTSARTKLLYTSPDARRVSSPDGPRDCGWIHAASGAWNSRKAAAMYQGQRSALLLIQVQTGARKIQTGRGKERETRKETHCLDHSHRRPHQTLHGSSSARLSRGSQSCSCRTALPVLHDAMHDTQLRRQLTGTQGRGEGLRLDAKPTRRPLLPLASETSSSDAGPSRESAAPTRSSWGLNSDAESLEGGGAVARGVNT